MRRPLVLPTQRLSLTCVCCCCGCRYNNVLTSKRHAGTYILINLVLVALGLTLVLILLCQRIRGHSKVAQRPTPRLTGRSCHYQKNAPAANAANAEALAHLRLLLRRPPRLSRTPSEFRMVRAPKQAPHLHRNRCASMGVNDETSKMHQWVILFHHQSS